MPPLCHVRARWSGGNRPWWSPRPWLSVNPDDPCFEAFAQVGEEVVTPVRGMANISCLPSSTLLSKAMDPRNRTSQPDREAAVEDARDRQKRNQSLEDDRATTVEQPPGWLARYLGAPVRYFRSDRNKVGDRIVIGVLAGVVLLAIGHFAGLGPGGGSTPTQVTTKALPPTATPKEASRLGQGGGREPKEPGCSSPAKDLPSRTLELTNNGFKFGTVVLRYSPGCNMTWGTAKGLGPEEKLRLVILESRPSAYVTTGYAHFGHSGIKGDKPFDTPGCVRAVAVTESSGKTLARARAPCQ
jgi:hypothetical protein